MGLNLSMTDEEYEEYMQLPYEPFNSDVWEDRPASRPTDYVPMSNLEWFLRSCRSDPEKNIDSFDPLRHCDDGRRT